MFENCSHYAVIKLLQPRQREGKLLYLKQNNYMVITFGFTTTLQEQPKCFTIKWPTEGKPQETIFKEFPIVTNLLYST